MNSVQLLGNLTREPDVRFTSKGTAYTHFSVACSHTYAPYGSTEAKTITDFVPCVAWGQLAEMIGNTMNKGSRVFVEGRFTTHSYTNKNGEKRYVTEVAASFVALGANAKASSPANPPQPAAPGQGFNDMGQPDNDEEIPF